MTITTKASLAAELGITKARVSQYVTKGLPVRDDGKINREPALNWIAQNNYPKVVKDKGAGRAKRLTRDVRAARPPIAREESAQEIEPSEDGPMYLVLADVIGRSENIVAEAALQAGVAPRVAYALSTLAILNLADCAERSLKQAGLRRFIGSFSFMEAIDGRVQEAQPDWAAIAAERGESFDEDAWYGDVDELRERVNA